MGDFSIQISANLVNRLANDGEKAKKKIARKTKQKSTREPSQSRTKVNEKQLHGESDARKGTTAPGLPVQPPFFTPVALPVPSQDTKLAEIQSVIQESERVLERLQKQEDTMVQEVTARAKDLRDKEFKLPYQKPMPCLAAYEACRECYKEHANDILKCGPLTRSYYDCARRVKQQVSSGAYNTVQLESGLSQSTSHFFDLFSYYLVHTMICHFALADRERIFKAVHPGYGGKVISS